MIGDIPHLLLDGVTLSLSSNGWKWEEQIASTTFSEIVFSYRVGENILYTPSIYWVPLPTARVAFPVNFFCFMQGCANGNHLSFPSTWRYFPLPCRPHWLQGLSLWHCPSLCSEGKAEGEGEGVKLMKLKQGSLLLGVTPRFLCLFEPSKSTRTMIVEGFFTRWCVFLGWQ